MRDILVRYYTGRAITSDEAVTVIRTYMYEIGKPNDRMLTELISGLSPLYPEMIKHAFEVSVQYFEKKEGLCKLYSGDKLIQIW